MLALFQDDEYVRAWTLNTPEEARLVIPWSHVWSAPAATASIAFGSASARLASGALGFSMSRSLHAPTARSEAAPSHRAILYCRIRWVSIVVRRSLRTRARASPRS